MFTIKQVKTIFLTYKGNKFSGDYVINKVTTDSRIQTTDSLFVPIIGDTFNGHHFIEEAIQNGAIATLWQKDEPIPDLLKDKCVFFLVADTVRALQQLAAYYRSKVDPIVVAITGSNGKTTTKEIARTVFSTTYKTHATEGNLNNHIGLPLTILEMCTETEVLIVEMGMNHVKEIERLSTIAQPNYAIITNIGESHIEHLGSRVGIAEAKLEITAGLATNGLLFIDGDEPLLNHVKQQRYVRTCGFKSDNAVFISNVSTSNKTTTFEIAGNKYTLPLLGAHHAQNASFVIAVATELNISAETITTQLEQIEQTEMRFEWKKGRNGVTIINDAYNASPTSMKAAINILKNIKGFNTKGVVLGDILELGSFTDGFHLSVAKEIDSTIELLFTYGTHAKTISDYVKIHVPEITCEHFQSKDGIVSRLESYINQETVLLFKGSRGMRLEEIIERILD